MGAKPESKVVRRILWGWLVGFCVSLLTWFAIPVLFATEIPAGAFNFQATGWVSVANFFFLLLVFEIPIPLLELGFEQMDARRWIRVMAYLVMVPALVSGAWIFELTRFHAIVVEPEGVTLLGCVWTGPQTFRYDQLERVVLAKRRSWDELEFRWFDRVESSVWVYHFDVRSQGSLQQAVAALRGRGVVVTEDVRR